MARQEQEREDILQEATALVERVELQAAGDVEPTVAGFRRDGSASLYFGNDLVLQFNTQCELRRAFDQGRLVKSVGGKLVAMERVRDERSTTLMSRELSETETAALTKRMLAALHQLRDGLRSGTVHAVRQIPADRDVITRVRTWLDELGGTLRIAARPHVDGTG